MRTNREDFQPTHLTEPVPVVWNYAQANKMMILTANRNMKGKDSLEQVMREENNSTSFPIILFTQMSDTLSISILGLTHHYPRTQVLGSKL
jgi:hypothetical protein